MSDKDAQIARHQTELKHSQALNAKLTHENALLKRMKFAAQSERFNAEQCSLLEDEIEQLQPPTTVPETKQQPKRQPLPAHLLCARRVHGGTPRARQVRLREDEPGPVGMHEWARPYA